MGCLRKTDESFGLPPICQRSEDDSWSSARALGTTINTSALEYCSLISRDGNYFFFTRGGDIHWVESRVVLPDPNDPVLNTCQGN